ncbi:MAG: DUF4199 domain-containing protein [Chitinophagaceae bacterium]|nr:MAG: DUF4199 domain-containing protein [Chitinophagaceae bacterium]
MRPPALREARFAAKTTHMKKVVLRYGGFGILFLIVFSALSMATLNETSAYAELVGYLGIFLSMIFVFLGLRYYRDRVNGGVLRFGQGLKLGLLIVLLPAIGFGLFDVLYTRVINPSWFAHYSEQMQQKMTAAEKAQFVEQMNFMQQYPLAEFALMASSVLLIGVIVTIISTLALMRKPKQQLSV